MNEVSVRRSKTRRPVSPTAAMSFRLLTPPAAVEMHLAHGIGVITSAPTSSTLSEGDTALRSPALLEAVKPTSDMRK